MDGIQSVDQLQDVAQREANAIATVASGKVLTDRLQQQHPLRLIVVDQLGDIRHSSALFQILLLHAEVVHLGNHVEMKNFMTSVKQRMGEPEELDCAIYSSWRSFRFFLGVKMTADPAERRQLRLAPYNRYENTPQSERELFLLSAVPQGNPVTVQPNADDMPPPVKKVKRRKRPAPMPALESVG